MEVKEKSIKRERIKTIAIVFLAVMLVLTFFSGTIMNYSLPEVATQMVTSGTINAKIRGSGTLAANESYEVNIKQTREVRSVCVKVGDTVEQGDLLFVLGDVESAELKAAQEALENARISYQRRVLELSKSYENDDLAVKTIREDLEKAIAQRDANRVTDEEISFAKGDLAAAKSELSQTQLYIADLKDHQSDENDTKEEEKAVAELEAKVTKLKGEITELESEIKLLDADVETYEEDLNKLAGGEDIDIDRKIQDASSALDSAVTNWKSDWTAYRSFINALVAEGGLNVTVNLNSSGVYTFTSADQIAIEGALRGWALLPAAGMPSTEDGGGEASGAAPQTLSAGRETQPVELKNWQTAYEALLADQKDVETKQTALDRLRQDSSIASGSTAQQRRAIRDKLDAAEAKRAAAQSELRGKQSDLRVAEDDLRSAESSLRSAQQALDNAAALLKEQIRAWEATQRQQEAGIATLEENLAQLQEKQGIYKAAGEAIDAKQRELETALAGKDTDKQLNNLELQALSLEINKQQELVDKYRADSVDAEIVSPVSGVVNAIQVSAGKEASPDQPMAVIDVVDRGYTLKFSVTSEQAKQVRVGDTAEVTNYYWGSEVDAVLESIASDPSSAGKNKLLVFRVSGDVEAGQNITLSVGQRSASMDAVIPKSALREDSNGKFVYTITSRNTPLGNRYTAVRADVQVLAEDDTSAAVSGLAPNDYVITTASKPLDAGSQVRMVENP